MQFYFYRNYYNLHFNLNVYSGACLKVKEHLKSIQLEGCEGCHKRNELKFYQKINLLFNSILSFEIAHFLIYLTLCLLIFLYVSIF